jgi:SPP1 family phage portal protein
METLTRQTESTIFSPSLSSSDIAQIIVENGKNDAKIRDMKTAQKYFDGHSDIELKKRVYYDKKKVAYENPAANNAKQKSGFLRQLVEQKQNYAFAKTFVLKLSTAESKEVDLTKDEYGIAWKDFCDRSLFKTVYQLGGQSILNGIAWGYLWIDENGDLQIKDIPPEMTYPVWHDRQHTHLDRLVYNFYRLKYNSITPDRTEYAEYWTESERILFNATDGYKPETTLVDDKDNPIFSHMTGGVSWGKVPYIFLKATDDEKPLLNFIKEQVDSYEKMDSNSVDSLIDDLDPLLVLKGVSPNVKDLLEARELAKVTRTVSLDPDGDAHFIQAQTQIQSYIEKLNALRKDIYKFGYGVDTQDARFGGNPNQLEIKSLYQDLDTYTDGLERHLQDFIDQLKYFFDKWWEFSGHGAFVIAQSYKALVKLDRSMLINQSALIDDTVKLQSTGVSQKTLLEFNPAVQDVEQEKKRLEEEKKERDADNSLFDFGKEPEEKEGENKGEDE